MRQVTQSIMVTGETRVGSVSLGDKLTGESPQALHLVDGDLDAHVRQTALLKALMIPLAPVQRLARNGTFDWRWPFWHGDLVDASGLTLTVCRDRRNEGLTRDPKQARESHW